MIKRLLITLVLAVLLGTFIDWFLMTDLGRPLQDWNWLIVIVVGSLLIYWALKEGGDD